MQNLTWRSSTTAGYVAHRGWQLASPQSRTHLDVTHTTTQQRHENVGARLVWKRSWSASRQKNVSARGLVAAAAVVPERWRWQRRLGRYVKARRRHQLLRVADVTAQPTKNWQPNTMATLQRQQHAARDTESTGRSQNILSEIQNTFMT